MRKTLASPGMPGELVSLRTNEYRIVGQVLTSNMASETLFHGSIDIDGSAHRWVCPFRGFPVGAEAVMSGFWQVHETYGPQFNAETVVAVRPPSDRARLAQYLAANIGGVGAKRAKRLIDVFGANHVVQRLREDPEVVTRLWPDARGRQVALGVLGWIKEIEAETWLHDMAPRLMEIADITFDKARKIMGYFGSSEVADMLLGQDPYRLLDVPGIGWTEADRIAARVGVRGDDMRRCRGMVQHLVRSGRREGHTGLPRAHLLLEASKRLRTAPVTIEQALSDLLEDMDLVEFSGLVMLPSSFHPELDVAECIQLVNRATRRMSEEDASKVERIIARHGLNDEQRDAVLNSVVRGVSIITGGPGTGKTFTVKALLEVHEYLGQAVRVIAPTGKAAARSSEVTGAPASTVHRLISGPVGGLREEGYIADCTLVIDEAGMLDIDVAAWLLKNLALGPDLRLVLVGDTGQLPSVGPGNVLGDLIEAGVPETSLRATHRQARESTIIVQASRIRSNEPLIHDERLDWRTVWLPEDPEEAHQVALEETIRAIGQRTSSIVGGDFDPIEDLLVLTPRRTGPMGVSSLNRDLRSVMNRSTKEGPYIVGDTRVRTGDRLVCLENNYTIGDGVMNGELGVVTDVAPADGRFWLDLGNRVERIEGLQCKSFDLGYALTVHRSQGSEAKVVTVLFHEAHIPLLDPRILYTAITRAKEWVVLMTTERALELSRSMAGKANRWTALSSLLDDMA